MITDLGEIAGVIPVEGFDWLLDLDFFFLGVGNG